MTDVLDGIVAIGIFFVISNLLVGVSILSRFRQVNAQCRTAGINTDHLTQIVLLSGLLVIIGVVTFVVLLSAFV